MAVLTEVILGLGSNIGDRANHLQCAIDALSRSLQDITASSIHESAALLPDGADESWNTPFLNMVIAGYTALSPDALLSNVKSIEQTLGRKSRGHWGPREIDIDIIAYGEQVISTSDLIIPHMEMCRRDFVLAPLVEIKPNWTYPAEGPHYKLTAKQLLARLQS